MPSFDIITIGSITLDIILPLEKETPIEFDLDKIHIPLGDKIRVNDSVFTCGGGASNSATGFAKLGLSAAALGVIGDKSSQGLIIQELKGAGVNTDYIEQEKGSHSSFSIILNTPGGERTVLHKRLQSELVKTSSWDKMPDSKAVYIGHLYDKTEEVLFRIPEIKDRYITWNPGKTQFRKGLDYFESILPHIDALILNTEEAEMFTGLKSVKRSCEDFESGDFGKMVDPVPFEPDFAKEIKDVREIAQKFLDMGVSKVVITDGGRGAQLLDGKNHLFIPSTKIPKVDTLGAGDAFAVGITAAALYSKDVQTQMQWASHCSAGVIQKFGGQAGQIRLDRLS